MRHSTRDRSSAHVIPSGELLKLTTRQLKPNPNNPRRLFDPEPLAALRENIRTHGVLVPITAYPLKGQDKYAILDGERRFKCCVDLEREGVPAIQIPANIVAQPDTVSGLLYMFSIHNFREQWELMPVAYGLKVVMEQLGETNPLRLHQLTGLSSKQIDRCRILLSFPERYQNLSLDPDPAVRIPANFWIELSPVLEIVERQLPDLVARRGREGVIDLLVDKYRAKKIRSVIHFRRIVEAFEVVDAQRDALAIRLRQYVTDVELETRAAFDQFLVGESGRVQNATRACQTFIDQLRKAKVDNVTDDRASLRRELSSVATFVQVLLDKLSGEDAPVEIVDGEDAE
jgi:ParB family chromosome partitioning protein